MCPGVHMHGAPGIPYPAPEISSSRHPRVLTRRQASPRPGHKALRGWDRDLLSEQERQLSLLTQCNKCWTGWAFRAKQLWPCSCLCSVLPSQGRSRQRSWPPSLYLEGGLPPQCTQDTGPGSPQHGLGDLHIQWFPAGGRSAPAPPHRDTWVRQQGRLRVSRMREGSAWGLAEGFTLLKKFFI